MYSTSNFMDQCIFMLCLTNKLLCYSYMESIIHTRVPSCVVQVSHRLDNHLQEVDAESDKIQSFNAIKISHSLIKYDS